MTEKEKLFSNYLVFYAPYDKIIKAMINTYCPSHLGEINGYSPDKCNREMDCEECWHFALKLRHKKCKELKEHYGKNLI